MKFQAQGIKFIEQAGGRVLLGDDMGLGKTLQVLAYLAMHTECRPAIIACPSSAKYEWEGQIKEHTRNLKCQVLTGQKPSKIFKDILIINYDIISYWEDVLLKIKPKALIMDECHYVKTQKIKRTKTCKKISRVCSVVIPMSGTPIVNRPSEFFPVLNMLFPVLFPSFWKYAFRYCDPKRGFQGRGWNFDGATKTEELHKRVAPFMIRRMKEEVLKELPLKRRIPIFVDLANKKEYIEARDDFLLWYKKEYGKERSKKAESALGFVRLGQLRQLAAGGKVKSAIKWIDDYLETTGKKLVVFSYHKKIHNHLIAEYSKIAAQGGKAGKMRRTEVQRFQNDKKCRLFLGTIGADKEAITLTAASAVLFIEMGWTPGEHDQAEDRINRIGQTANSITAYYLLAKDSIDEYVWELIEKKRRIIAQILDGEEASESAQKQVSLGQLIKNLHRKKEK